jgi:membrane protein DedA with SNARE-associated domain
MPQPRPEILKYPPQNVIGSVIIVCSTVYTGIFLVETYRLKVSVNQNMCACVRAYMCVCVCVCERERERELRASDRGHNIHKIYK